MICIGENTQVFNLLTVIPKTHATSKFYQHSISHAANLLLSVSLSGSSSLFPISFLPVDVSHKYSDVLIRWYHCNELIGSKWMFHLVITHNTFYNMWHKYKSNVCEQLWAIDHHDIQQNDIQHYGI
jgi:hypothetical protein